MPYALCPMPCPEELLSNRADVVASEVVIRRRPYLQALDWAVAGAECNTVIELKQAHHAA